MEVSFNIFYVVIWTLYAYNVDLKQVFAVYGTGLKIEQQHCSANSLLWQDVLVIEVVYDCTIQ